MVDDFRDVLPKKMWPTPISRHPDYTHMNAPAFISFHYSSAMETFSGALLVHFMFGI